jgi:hypothetical protein
MHTITLQINDERVVKTLQDMERSQFISILENSEFDSPALPGAPMSITAFKSWIGASEQTETVSLTQAKEKWASKRKQLLKLTK